MRKSLGGLRITQKMSLREEVYQSLKKSILSGKLRPGQRLIEEQVAGQVGISRTPVREAFYKLERDDLVFRLPKGGFAVREFTREDIEEIYGIRCALESYAAHLATLHITSDKIALLRKKAEELEKTIDSGDDERIIQLHTDFHETLYKSSKSKRLIELLNYYHDFFYSYRFALHPFSAGFKASIADHRNIIKAMEKKNPRLVERLVRNHLERGRDLLLRGMK